MYFIAIAFELSDYVFFYFTTRSLRSLKTQRKQSCFLISFNREILIEENQLFLRNKPQGYINNHTFTLRGQCRTFLI
jgi:hypothetical protein